jgi:capsular exopolysaccharide synthesis family protein
MTTEFGAEPTFRTYLAVLRRRKWWVVSIALLGLWASLALSVTAHKQYSATAQVLVQPSTQTSALGAVQQPVTPTEVQTELQLVTSAPVQRTVSQQLGNVPAVSAAEVAQTNVIAITATSGVPARAARIANTYAKAFVGYQQTVASRNLAAAETQLQSQISSLAKQLKSLGSDSTASPETTALLNQEAVLKEQLAQMQVSGVVGPGGVELVTPAQPPTSPSSPKPVQNAMLGLAAGLLLGLGAAFLRDSLDDTLSSKEAVEHAASSPVLVMVPMVTSWRRSRKALVVSVTDPTSPAAESYRSLRTSLQFARQEGEMRSLVVTSPAAGDGKTSTIANLGAVFAQTGERVVLVSCDLRRPRLGEFFGLDEEAGLTTILLGQRSLEESLRPVAGYDRLLVLPAGPIPPNPAELLDSGHARQIFATLRDSFDLVLIDSPPVLPVTDAVVLSKHADATLLVAAAGQTTRGDLRRAVEKLAQVNATILGTVLNQVTRQNSYGYGSGYGYSYGYKPYVTERAHASAAQHPNGKPAVSDASIQ